jgi:ssDNA-binding Zn-finger/Zn-ribbon topoisomerase 1
MSEADCTTPLFWRQQFHFYRHDLASLFVEMTSEQKGASCNPLLTFIAQKRIAQQYVFSLSSVQPSSENDSQTRSGAFFWGCCAYPKCQGSRPAEEGRRPPEERRR